jgi:polyhydroxybutyrate depolymerase
MSLQKITNAFLCCTLLVGFFLWNIQSNAMDIRPFRETTTIEFNNRTYDIFIPPHIQNGDKKVPLLLTFHPGGGNARYMSHLTGLTRKANEWGFIVVYPNGTGQDKEKVLTWNATHCCHYAMENKIDDIHFIRSLIDDLLVKYPIDSKGIYVTGMSNGAIMAHHIAAAMPEKIAGLATVVGGLFGDEPIPSHGVPTLIINGALDTAIPVDGGVSKGQHAYAWDGTPLKPASYQSFFWARANGCDIGTGEMMVEHPNKRVSYWQYQCPKGMDVERYLVRDEGHAWMGSPDNKNKNAHMFLFDATNIILDFFKRHRETVKQGQGY